MVVAEYSLRGIGSPIGISQYSLTRQLPDELKQLLPSATELEEQLQLEERGLENHLF